MKESDMQTLIIDTAIKRLSHFGVQKTALTEIADDLHITKQALMYYFNDKASLITSVINKIAEEYQNALETIVEHNYGITKLFIELIELRHQFFKKYHLLFAQFSIDNLGKQNSIHEAVKSLHQNEVNIISTFCTKKSDALKIAVTAIKPTIVLLLDTLNAIAKSVCFHTPIPDEKAFRLINQKQKKVARLMIEGIIK